jgi:hypothetical protein
MAEAQLDLSARTLITRADFAKRKGVSRAAVTIAVGSGRLHGPALGPMKKLVLPFADQQWPDKTGEDGAATAREEDEDTADESSGEMRTEKLKSLRLKNERAQLEIDVEKGSLVSMSEVAAALGLMGADITQALEAIAGWAAELAAVPQGDVQAMRAALKERVRKLREKMVERLSKLSANEESDDDGE